MARHFLRTALAIALAMGSLCALATPDRVTIVTLGSGGTLWLPPQTTPAQQAQATDAVSRFQRTWERLFGSPATLPDPLIVPAAPKFSESLFSSLWLNASASLAPGDRPAALGALRMILLNDPTAFVETLTRASISGRWDESLAEGVALYAFLQEEADVPAFLPEALPPGPGAVRLRAALARREVSWDLFFNRFAAWLLTRAVEMHLLSPASGTLPAVWVLDTHLAPGEAAGWRFLVSDPAVAVSLELAGEASPGVRLFHVFTDEQGHALGAGLCDLKPGPLVLPRKGSWLWVFVWNASRSESWGSTALTLWSNYQVPFTVLDTALSSSHVLDLRLREEPGVADYRLWSGPDENGQNAKILAGPFASEGEGEHLYRITVPTLGPDLRLTCRTFAGGAYSSLLPPAEKEP